MIFLTHTSGYDKLVPTDQMGLPYTKEQVRGFIRILTAYLNEFPDEQLESEHEAFRREYFPHEFDLLPGYVYLMKDTEGWYKIGMSDDPDRRLKAISRKHKGAKLLHTIPADQMDKAEIALQDKYRSKHIRGDWFSLSGDDIAAIQSITEYENGEFFK